MTIAGAKLTAYRRMAERVVETVAPLIGRVLVRVAERRSDAARRRPSRCPRPATFAALPGVRSALEAIPPEMAARLIATYGSDAIEVARTADGPDALSMVAPDVPLSVAEVQYAIRHEMALTLVDILERRTRLSYFATESARAAAPRSRRSRPASSPGTPSRIGREIEGFARQCDARLAWRDAPESQRSPQIEKETR